MDVKKLYEWSKKNDNSKVTETREWESIWKYYKDAKKDQYESLKAREALPLFLSELNYIQRKDKNSSLDMGVYVKVGDVCFIDFGEAYIQEIGYQHFGLIISIFRNKAFVVPMSGNEAIFDELQDPQGRKNRPHLMPFEKIEGMNKNTILFLNDAKYINTARIIDVKAHLDPDSDRFSEIKEQLLDCIFQTNLL